MFVSIYMLEQSLCANPNLNDKSFYAKSIIFLAIFIFKDNGMMKMAKVGIFIFLFGFLGLFLFSCSNGSGGGSGDDSYYAPTTPSSNTGSSSNNDNGEKDEDNDDTEELPTNYMDSPYILKVGTDGSAGTEATYVLFGEWPQTIKAQDVEITELIDQDKHLYLGSDGCKYFKMQANPHINKYWSFSDGSNIVDKEEYYFKVEPIKWIVLTTNYNETGNALLYSEKILISGIPYDMTHYWLQDYTEKNYIFKRSSSKDKNIYPSNYEYSSVRAVLNGLSYISHYGNQEINSYKINSDEIKFKDNGFLQNAFSFEGQNLIETTYIKNDSDSMKYYPLDDVADGKQDGTIDLRCNDTQDKIFILSLSELNLIKKTESICYSDIYFTFLTSDFIRASGLKLTTVYSDMPKDSTMDWYSRTPVSVKSNYSIGVNDDGNIIYRKGFWISNKGCIIPVADNSSGICPALTIKLD